MNAQLRCTRGHAADWNKDWCGCGAPILHPESGDQRVYAKAAHEGLIPGHVDPVLEVHPDVGAEQLRRDAWRDFDEPEHVTPTDDGSLR